jgi:biotin operon repressor
MTSSQSDLGALLQRTNDLLLILVKAHLRPVIEAELSDSKRKELYLLTGGSVPIKKLSEKLGMSTGAISRVWQHWEDVGLLIKDGKSYRRVIS